MPAPSNQTALTAIDLGALPATLSVDVADSGVNYTTWYSIVAPSDGTMGAFCYNASRTIVTKVYVGPASAPVAWPTDQVSAANKPCCFPVESGVTYYLEVDPLGSPITPCVISISVLQHAPVPVPAGSIVVPNDVEDHGIAFIGVDDSNLDFLTFFPPTECGDILETGVVCINDEDAERIALYSPALVETSSYDYKTALGLPFAGILTLRRSPNDTRFYFGFNGFFGGPSNDHPAWASWISADGLAFGPKLAIGGYSTASAIAPKPDDTELYYIAGGTNKPIKRWDVVNNVGLSDFVASIGATTATFVDGMLTLANGDVVVACRAGGSYKLQVYDSSGTLVNTIVIGAFFVDKIASSPTATNVFVWIQEDSTNAISEFREYNARTGALIQTITNYQFEHGVWAAFITTATPPALFGHSQSCPFWISRIAYPPAPTPTLSPVPVAVPKAAQAPCEPQAQVGNGGKGQGGCNVGGVGGGHEYDVADGLGDVPQHDDPDDGETLTGAPGVALEPWIELVHTDYPSGDKTTYRRAFEELADDPDVFESGRKESGLLAIGEIEHGLGNEQGGFEAATVDVELSDVRDRLFRGLADDQDVDGDECRIKLASDGARALGTTPKTLMRGIVQKGVLESMLRSRLTVVDWLFSDFGPFGPGRKDPNWTFGDLGAAAPDMTSDTKAQVIPLHYFEKSDEGAVDPLTNLPRSKGLLPFFYLGMFDLSGDTLPDTPPSPGRTLEELVAIMNQLVADGVATVSWVDTIGYDLGTADIDTMLAATGNAIPTTFEGLAGYLGSADVTAALAAGTTAAPTSAEWGFLASGLGPWFQYTGVYGSNLQNGDPQAKPDRTRLDPATRSDVMVPGINWPLANPYVAFTNPDTGRTFWLTGIFVRGPLLTAHLTGEVTMACNAIGIEDVGDGSGLPIGRVEDAKQHRLENHWINQWSSGPYATAITFPQFNDGVPMVRSSSFTARQNFFKQQLGGEGLLVSWYTDKPQANLDIVRQWNRETDSRLGVNQHGQIVDFGIDETVDPSTWPRLNHITDVFGPITRTSGEERENVVAGSCDFDPDFEKYRAGPFTVRSENGIAKYKGRIKQGDVIESQILDNATHFQWVLQRRLARLQFGVTLLEVPGPLDPWANYDVGQGVLFNSEDGPGPNGYEDHPFIIMRRKPDLVNRLITFTLWDVRDVLIETAFAGGLDQLFSASDDEDEAPMETDDEDLAPLEIR